MKKLLLNLEIILFMLLLGACNYEPLNLESRIATAQINPAVVADWIIQGRNDFLLIDLRPELNFKKTHIPKAVNLSKDKMTDERTVAALPNFKKLVYYDQADGIEAENLLPALRRGLHVMVIKGGYDAWLKEIMTPPELEDSLASAKRFAISKYFRGESTLGTAQPIPKISADAYISAPTTLPLLETDAAPFQEEGC